MLAIFVYFFFPQDTFLTRFINWKLTVTKDVAEGNATSENDRPSAVDNMEVDVGENKAKMEVTPVAVQVTAPPVSTKNSASSKPTKKRITPIAIN